ncbi:MAG: hypothetical protein AB7F40_02880 [Victivallaceae bacterium]|nr:hypothetical protein [Victivallaceae bacterium]
MNFEEMNLKLAFLAGKYAVAERGEITPGKHGAQLKYADGRSAVLLPWRVERRFAELRKMTEDGTLEDVSTLRLAAADGSKTLGELMFRELDICAFLGKSEISGVFMVAGGGSTANLLVKLADGKRAAIELSCILPGGAEPMDRHELIARRGVACDRVVDTQVPQSSIYMFTSDGEARYTDTDSELFGLSAEEINTVRAAFELLKNPDLADEWNTCAVRAERVAAAALESAETMNPATFPEAR